MERQQSLLAEIIALVLHVNRISGVAATATVGSVHHEVNILVLDEQRIEPRLVRTVHLGHEGDTELTLARAYRNLSELRDQVNHLANALTPRGAA